MMLTSGFMKRKRSDLAPLILTFPVLSEIRNTIGVLPAEHGGVLGGRPDQGIVTEFYFDRAAQRNAVTYKPDDKLLNRLFAVDWNPRGIRVLGFVHSHPGLRTPSQDDLFYAQRILQAIPDLERLLIPIVISAAAGARFEILPYAVVRQGDGIDVAPLKMMVFDDQGQSIENWESEVIPHLHSEPRINSMMVSGLETAAVETVQDGPVAAATIADVPPVTPPCSRIPEAFRRVTQAYDLDLMKRSRIICVGTGGAAGFIEDLVRAGIGQFALIDPDTVTESNLATQQTYHRDVGRAKVDAIADRIRDINPDALVLPLRASLDDLNDQAFEFYALASTFQRGVIQSLLCGLTDNFHAQARVNRLALHYGLPSLCAQVYREGRGAEISFTHPASTPACHRCVLSSRYRAYLHENYTNSVTSDGTPIFATARLNALKGFIALAILHHGTHHARWGSLLRRIGKRNLIQIRMDPDLADTVGISVFDRTLGGCDTERLLFDEAVWLPQEPDGPATGFPTCLDCGGTGNLRDVIGTFSDTRIMRI
jgi:proteasome lid subunit RPN8/RPN11